MCLHSACLHLVLHLARSMLLCFFTVGFICENGRHEDMMRNIPKLCFSVLWLIYNAVVFAAPMWSETVYGCPETDHSVAL